MSIICFRCYIYEAFAFVDKGYNLSPLQHNANAAGKAVALPWILSLLGLQTDLQFGPSLARWQIKLTSLLMLRSPVSFHLCNLMKDSSTLSEIRQRVQKSWQCQAAWELRDETCEPGFLYLQYLVWTVTWELITNLAAMKNLLEHIFRGRLLENSWESKIMKEKHN